ncbi:MAG TPA: hypothetical protein VIV61_15960 [Candidatus Ozemobacteraceae bacterium]
MYRYTKNAAFLFLAGALSAWMPAVAAPPTGPEECMVIGEEADTVKGTKLYMDAVSAWRQGLRQKALDQYEAALLADRGVLARPDEGMALALLERYRERVGTASPTAGLLCRQGFFENIISGNLESAIAEYRKAAAIAGTEAAKQTAAREADRLQAQLEYLRTWQAEYRRKVALQRRQQDAEVVFQGRVEAVDDRIVQLEDERAELEERLAYLRRQEADGREELMTSIRRASRYRRAQYYPGREYQPDVPATSYPGPAVGPLPSPPPGAPGPLPSTTSTSPTPTPTVPTYQMPTEGSNLSLFYRNRNEALQNESALYSIRAEITGVERRIEEIDKLIEKTSKERDELFNPPPAKKPPVVATGSTPIRE